MLLVFLLSLSHIYSPYHSFAYSLPQASSKKKKEQERSQVLIEKLQEERKRQDDNHQLVLSWIRQEKDSWFSPRELHVHVYMSLGLHLGGGGRGQVNRDVSY